MLSIVPCRPDQSIRRSYVSGRTRLWRGERLTIWCWRRAPSQNVWACCCQPGYQPERTQPHKILSFSILKTMNNKWVHSTKHSSLFLQDGRQRLGHRGHSTQTHYFIRPNYDFLCVCESMITASIIWSVFAFENVAVWWGLFMMRTVMYNPCKRDKKQLPICLRVYFSNSSILNSDVSLWHKLQHKPTYRT